MIWPMAQQYRNVYIIITSNTKFSDLVQQISEK